MSTREEIVELILAEVGQEVERFVGELSVADDKLDDLEERCRALAKVCGASAFKVAVTAMLAAQDLGKEGSWVATAGGGRAYFERYEPRWVITHLGRFRIRRAYYWDADSGRGRIPLDEKWDLDERAPSPSLRRSIGVLAAEAPFARDRRIMRQVGLVDLPEKRFQESSEALGAKMKETSRAATAKVLPMLRDAAVSLPEVPAAERRGTLYIEMDGGRLNTVEDGWKEPKVATLFWDEDIVEVSKDRREILKREYVAVLDNAEELANRLWEAACRWEWWKAARVVVLGDGAPWIWNRAEELFPDATMILDQGHAFEHIWDCAKVLFRGRGRKKSTKRDEDDGKEGKPSEADLQTRAWANARIDELTAGDVDAVLADLRSQRPSREEAKEAVSGLMGYLEDNQERMRYAEYRAQGLMVGSGAIESGIKNVVNLRMKGCGMRWALERAENMLNLRAAHLSTVGPTHEVLEPLAA